METFYQTSFIYLRSVTGIHRKLFITVNLTVLNYRKKTTKTHFKIDRSLLACLQRLVLLVSDVISPLP